MDIRKVKKLIELLEESNIDEIEIHEGEESVRISRNKAGECAGELCPGAGDGAASAAGTGGRGCSGSARTGGGSRAGIGG